MRAFTRTVLYLGPDPELVVAIMIVLINRFARNLLRVARLEEGLALEPRPCDVVALCRGQVDLAATLAPELEVTHCTDVFTALAVVDPHALEESVENLLDNARRHATRRIEVATEAVGDVLEIRVLDDGPGMDEEVASRAFDRFASLDGMGGSGLGLCIARALARAHGGDVTYRGRSGRFVVTLPMSPPGGRGG